MAKKKQELEFEDYEDEAEGEEYAEGDDEYEDDEDEEEDEDDEPRRGGMGGLLLLILVGIVVVGGGAYFYMSGGNIPLLSSLPFLNKSVAPPTQIASRQDLKQPLAAQASGSHAAVSTKGESPSTRTAKTETHPVGKTSATKTSGESTAKGAAHLAPKTAHEAAAAAHATPAKVAVTHKAQLTHKAQVAQSKAAKLAEHPHSRVLRRPIRKVRWHRHIIARRRRWHPTYRHAGGLWTVQVGAFSQPGNASRLIGNLKSKGYLAYASGGAIVAGHFSVFSNTVDTRAKALQLSKQFRAAGQHPRIVRQGRHFAVALGRFESQGAAGNLVRKLNSKGLFATMSGHAGSTRHGGPNRVMVGRYSSRAAAEAAASRLRGLLGAAIVVRR